MVWRLFFQIALSGGIALAGLRGAAGQLETTPNSTFRLKRWTANDGLPQGRVACIKQTRDGYLWIGTWYGLARFDGRRFTVFDNANTGALTKNEINALAEDAAGTLWIGTREGLVSYRNGHFGKRFTSDDGLPDSEIWHLEAGRGGGLWIHAGASVAVLREGKIAQTRRLPLGGAIHAMQERADGGLDILTGRHWLSWFPQGDQIRTNFAQPSAAAGWDWAQFSRNSNSAWIGTSQGLMRLQNESLQKLSDVEFGQDYPNFLFEDRTGHVWMELPSHGLLRRTATGWENFAAPEPVGTLICMEEDEEGSVWAGTENGLLQFRSVPIKVFTARDGLAHNQVLSVCEGTAGEIWVATQHGLSCIRSNVVVPLAAKEPAPDVPDRAVCPRAGGGVWLGKHGVGLFEFSEAGFRQWPQAPLNLVNCLFEDHSGRVWMAGSGGLFSLKDGSVTDFSTNLPPGVAADVHCIFEDHQGGFWLGTRSHGLVHFAGGQYSIFSEKQGLHGGGVWSISQDADGALWLGTENGLVRFHHGSFFTFTGRHGLLEPSINCVLQDDFGYLWLSGLHGIYILELAKLNEVANGRAEKAPCFALGAADGMDNVETNGGENQPAGWKSRDGRLWFPTVTGVVVIDPRTIPLHEKPPKVLIEQVKANDRVVPAPENAAASLNKAAKVKSPRAQIKPGEGRVVELSYTATTFVAAERARFRYRLAEVDTDWHEQTQDRRASYFNLRPGDYRFEVKAANHHNVWSEAPAVFRFSLEPFFWQTRTFYALCGVGAIGLAVIVQGYRLRWQRRVLQLEQQRALANERGRIARDLHDDLGGTLTGIALQLEAARRRGQADGKELALLADESRALSRELRELAWTTNPRCDNAGSLAVFIGESAERFCRAAGLECRLRLPAMDGSEEVPARVRYELLAVLKESLANAAKYAQAQTVTVDLAADNGDLRLTIKDDGQGFDLARAAAGTGLKNLRERVQQAGGRLKVESQPGLGTTIMARVPLARRERSS